MSDQTDAVNQAGATVVYYMYRDASNYKEPARLELAGLMSAAQREAVFAHTIGDYHQFYPQQVDMYDPREAMVDRSSEYDNDPMASELTEIIVSPGWCARAGAEPVDAWVSRFLSHAWNVEG